MHDPMTLICSFPPYRFKNWLDDKGWLPKNMAHRVIFNLWHVDPDVRGDDDSCGWFMRARHGNDKVLEKIIRDFEFDWDRVFKSESGKTYHRGYFHPESDGGMPVMSVSGTALNLFLVAAGHHFSRGRQPDWDRAHQFCRKHLFDILIFAENPTDSLRDSLVRTFGKSDKRKERIRSVASCVYAWILRESRPWYKHPRWHVHHWSFQFPALQLLNRRLFKKCSVCGKGFKIGDAAISQGYTDEISHERCVSVGLKSDSVASN
jgi:hypothetical protein